MPAKIKDLVQRTHRCSIPFLAVRGNGDLPRGYIDELTQWASELQGSRLGALDELIYPLTEYLRCRLEADKLRGCRRRTRKSSCSSVLTFAPLRDWWAEVVSLGLCVMFPIEVRNPNARSKVRERR